jgi:hypothetical protein
MAAEPRRGDAARLIAAGLVLAAGQGGLLALAPALADEMRAAPGPVLGFVAIAMLCGAAWLGAIGPLLRLPPRPAVLLGLLVFGAALRLAWIAAPPVLDTDHLRYLWDGALAAHGVWPWGAPPAAIGSAGLGEAGAALQAVLPFAQLRTIYPATAQAAFLAAHVLAPWEVLGLRLVMLAAEAATLVLLVLVLRRMGLPAMRAAIWWCCPLLPLVLVNAAHVDALLPPLLLGALLATLAGRGAAAGALLGLAAGVKVWPLLLAPLLGRWLPPAARLPGATALALVGGAMLAPLAATAIAPDAGLAAYAAGWSANNAPFAWARAAFGPATDALLRPLLALAGAAVALAVALPVPGPPAALARGALIVAAATFYLSPAQFPWYAVWFMPFATLLACRPLLLPAALLPLYWLWFPLRDLGLGPLFAHGVAALHALPVLALLMLRGQRAAARA